MSGIKGIGVSPGTRLGPAHLLSPPVGPIDNEQVTDGDAQALDDAFQAVATRLDEQAAEADGELAEVLLMTAELARDRGLIKASHKKLRDGVGPTNAVAQASAEYAVMLESLGGYMAERVTDLESIRDRVIAHLRGLPAPGALDRDEPGILVATDLSPAQTAELDLDRVIGIVTEKGGPTSHTAILASTLNIPAVVAAHGVTNVADGDMILLDGRTGEIEINPDAESARQRLEHASAIDEFYASASGPGQTKDGHGIQLKINIGTVDDAKRTSRVDCEGVGLLRTEFMFLDVTQPPSVEEQTRALSTIAGCFDGRPITVRTLDIGADKPVPFIDQSNEENPALGVRGIRLCQDNSELLTTQLQAIGQVGAENIQVMAPMVSTVDEVQWFTDLARQHGVARIGIMIETPAAALRARSLMADLDFVSIGTNDLTQYVMAADRLSPELAHLTTAWHPAVLDLISLTCQAGQETDTEVGVCGEAAGDPLLALVLTGLGVGSLSMSPAKLPAVRATLARVTMEECRALAREARQADTPEKARDCVLSQVPELRDLV